MVRSKKLRNACILIATCGVLVGFGFFARTFIVEAAPTSSSSEPMTDKLRNLGQPGDPALGSRIDVAKNGDKSPGSAIHVGAETDGAPTVHHYPKF